MTNPPIHRENPYAAPQAAGEWYQESRKSHSWLISVVSAGVSLAFIGFTALLLTSTAEDFSAGLMFLANIPFVVGIPIAAVWSTRKASYFAIAAGLTQIGIATLMLLLGVGDEPIVLTINVIIVLPFAVLALWAWIHAKRSARDADSNPSVD